MASESQSAGEVSGGMETGVLCFYSVLVSTSPATSFRPHLRVKEVATSSRAKFGELSSPSWCE